MAETGAEVGDASAEDEETSADALDTEPCVTQVEVDLFLSFEEPDRETWNADAVFCEALTGLFDALVPAMISAEVHIHSDGDLSFSRDRELPAPPIDRCATNLIKKRARERASNVLDRVLKHPLYGNSRSPSRASSRAPSRLSTAVAGSVLAVRMAKLALNSSGATSNGDGPFRITEWNEEPREDATARSRVGPGHAFDPYTGLSSRFSLASGRTGQTSRVTVDYQEVKRREDIIRDIETREGRDRHTARIQRKGHLRLKLRSMADPSISVDREERDAAAKSRGGLRSRGRTGTSGALLSRMNSMTDVSLYGSTSRTHETTYRPEDYEGVESEMVLIDKRGELLVGRNCHLVARKARPDMQRDLFQRNTIQPRVHFPGDDEAADDARNTLSTESPSTPSPDRSLQSRQSPKRAPSRRSPTRADLPTEAAAIQQNPVFEGCNSSYQSYPRIELDPKKTPLVKGVTIKVPESSVSSTSASQPLKEIKRAKLKPAGVTEKTLSEDHWNKQLESSSLTLARIVQNESTANEQKSPEIIASARSTTRTEVDSATSLRSRYAHQGGNHELHSLRLRTPAYGNRTGRGPTSAISSLLSREAHLTSIEDDAEELHEAVNRTASLQAKQKAASLFPPPSSLPKFSSYVREFPTPSKGQVHVVSSQAAKVLVSPSRDPGTYPFAALPSVIRNKR